MKISENALLKRIRRRLKRQGHRLDRNARENRFDVVDDRNCVVDYTSDIEQFGHELGVLADGERLQ